jgi:26S proteasome regulatory subunit N10
MPLEATVICLDNSEFMRNGDYMPTRIEAQQDAVNLICAAKTQQNPESTVAVMTMAQGKGARAEVLVTLTQDLGKILSSIHSVKIGGEGDLSSAVQVALLVLKHRQNKNQHQRIVAFVGSPVKESAEDLVKLGKKLKKNNIAVDVINFGEVQQNSEKLEAFISAVNTNDESHIVTIPPGPHILSEIILSSPVVVGEGGGGGFGAAAAASAAAAAAHASGATGGEFDFGVDPTLDPELAMALRLSMEEERARQAAAAAAAGGEKKAEEGQKQEAQAQAQAQAPVPSADVEMADFDDDLKAAMALSMGGQPASGGGEAMELSEDEQIQMAMRMSMQQEQQQQQQQQQQQASQQPSAGGDLQDQDFLNSVLSSLPGVDPNDERIRGVLSSIKKDEKKDNEKK